LFHSHSIKNNIGREGAIKLAEALKSNSTLTHLELTCTFLVASCSFSLNTANSIDTEGAFALAEALKSNTSLTHIELPCKQICSFISCSLTTANKIGAEGALKIGEALKSNLYLTWLNLNGTDLLQHSFSLNSANKFPDEVSPRNLPMWTFTQLRDQNKKNMGQNS
jgi:hypothetical protein